MPTKKVNPRAVPTRKKPPIMTNTKGVEIDPFEGDMAEQVLRRRDQGVFIMDKKTLVTRSELSGAGDATGGRAVRVFWRTPLLYSENAAGTTPKEDARGLVTDVYGGQVQFTNLTTETLTIKINTPKGHILFGSIYKIGSRDTDTEVLLRPKSSYVYRYSFWQNSTTVLPYYNKVQTKAGGRFTPHMVLADFTVVVPDISENTGSAIPDEMEVVEVRVRHNYAAAASMVPGATQISAPQLVMSQLESVAEMYKVDAVVEPSQGSTRAPVNGYRMITVDPERHDAVGYRYLLNGKPFTDDDLAEGPSEGDVITVQLCTSRNGLTSPASISEYESVWARLTTSFGVPYADEKNTCQGHLHEWRYDRESRSFKLWNNEYKTFHQVSWPEKKDLVVSARDTPIIAYNSDGQLSDVHISLATIIAVLEAASAIIGIIKKFNSRK